CGHAREAGAGRQGAPVQMRCALGAARRSTPRLRTGRRHPAGLLPTERDCGSEGGGMSEAPLLAEDRVVALEGYARLRFDKVRDRWVLLAPERVLFPCPTTVTILERLDGRRTLGEVVDVLAAEFEAPRETIAADTVRMLDDLARQR